MTQESPNLNGYPENNTQVFNIKDSLLKYVHYWWLFLLLVALAMTCAWIYLRYATPTYAVSSTLLIRNENSNLGGAGGSGDNIFSSSLCPISPTIGAVVALVISVLVVTLSFNRSRI